MVQSSIHASTPHLTPMNPARDIFTQEAVSSIPLMDAALRPDRGILKQDMAMKDLDEVEGWLWIAGAKYNVYPLHHQRVLLRQIIPTDQSRLHLVWFDRNIYVKPLPDCLLDHEYVKNRVVEDHCIRRAVVGFLHSYIKLIISPTDLRVAHEVGLLNAKVEWPAWSAYRASILEHTQRDDPTCRKGRMPFALEDTTPRYSFGELRLSRLNMVWRITGRGLVYFTVHREYNSYFEEYFSLFVAAFAIVATVLTAMQVLIGIDGVPTAVSKVSYWFGIVSILVILACLAAVLLLFISLFFHNAFRTLYHQTWRNRRSRRT